MDMTPRLNRLIEMHTYARPAGSFVEGEFIKRYIVALGGATCDRHGNWMIVNGTRPRVVWSCHTDTVHKYGGRQKVRLKGSILRGRNVDSCLGSDDTVGVWLLCEMIRRGVPGRYLFHFGEERGCIGSRGLVADEPAWLAETDMVIALDRRGLTDVITHQCSSKTCSDDFARAVADQLNAGDSSLHYAPNDGGMYTDSESYADVVAECTNLSVGYSDAHSTRESVDCAHALRLLERLVSLDTSVLPVTRTPGDDGWAHIGTSPRHYDASTNDDTFWRTYREVDGGYTYTTCYACGSDCDEDDITCATCGASYPSLHDEDDATEYADELANRDLERASYLDATYADVQDALRAQLRIIQGKRRTH